jgi:adenylyl/guanylyl cyclase-like protein with sensor domain
MRRDDVNGNLRAHAREVLSPTAAERQRVAKIYEALRSVLGDSSTLQIGSYPRFTSVTPLHDLDVLNILGEWDGSEDEPVAALDSLERDLRNNFRNPTDLRLDIERQTHSITMSFSGTRGIVLSVDVVPAYVDRTNEFGDDMYVVPEIVTRSHSRRRSTYLELAEHHGQMRWLRSDPRGYIEVARRVNDHNSDFRKAVKIIKAWRASCKQRDEEFKLKSFHLEQIVTGYFADDPDLDIFGAVFRFFCELPRELVVPHIPDRADPEVMIDRYVEQLTVPERREIIALRDHLLIKLEESVSTISVQELLEAGVHQRASGAEAYLFDMGIPTLLEEEMRIRGRALMRDGFRETILGADGVIAVNRRIEFRLAGSIPQADLFKWKVKNDNRSPEPRGEITDHSTRNDPESTKYNGRHFVECYAIRGNVCIARARQDVVLRPS